MIIADTGFWVAIANDKDQYHALALEKFTRLSLILLNMALHSRKP
jgi:predicted nucleic acid-binding protein